MYWLAALFSHAGVAGINTGPDSTVSYINYIQNKGQWNSNVLYKGGFRGGQVFLENTAFTYLFYPADGLSKIHDHTKAKAERDNLLQFHVLRMDFVGAIVSHGTQTEDTQPFYHNYFLGKEPSGWATQVQLSRTVIYKNLYAGIDVKTFSSGNNLRYDLIVSPGGQPSKIQLKFTGQDQLSIRDGKLILSTSVGEIVQQAPIAYQIENGTIKTIRCRYSLSGTTLGFVVGAYNRSIPLVIDPTIIFASYTGSTSDNWGMSASYDAGGNAYTAGIAFGTGYPVTTGAFQTTFGGGPNSNFSAGFDISVSKFNASGSSLLFSTYLGGSGNDTPQSITVDNNNNLIVLGRTYSANFPVTAGCYDNSLAGGTDIIVTKFNLGGTALVGSSYVGGVLNDGVNYSDVETTLGSLKYNYADDGRGAVKVDNNNNIYVASSTVSTDFPVTPGCLQAAIGGLQDACVFKMDPNVTMLMFSTYLGGSANDAGYNLALDSKNQLYVTGGTESSNFPITAGALHTAYMGGIDGYVTHISTGGNTILQSSYIGTGSYDQSFFVQTDKTDHVYLYGQCSGNYPVSSGVYSNPNSGQFIHKLDPNLSLSIFSTQFGSGRGTPDIVPSAFLVDNCQNVYISGWGGILFGYNKPTSSTTGMPVTSGAFQPTTDGSDFYFAVFSKDLLGLSYATFFGGGLSEEHVDGGTSSFDKTGVIYQAICESCGGHQDMPSTPGVWSAQNGSGNCNNALVKYKMDLKQTVAQLNINPFVTKGCAPFGIHFLNNSVYAVHYKWNFGDGNTSTLATPSHTYITPGNYTVTLIATDSSTCNQTDTTYISIIVKAHSGFSMSAPVTICKGDSVNIHVSAPDATSFNWSPASSLSNPNIYNPTAWPSVSTTYSVTIVDTACNSTDVGTVLVNVNQNNTKILTDSLHLCIDDTVKLKASGVYSSYTWSSGQTAPKINVLQAGLYTLSTIDVNGCKGFDSIRVGGYTHVPMHSYSVSICAEQGILLATTQGTYTYHWNPPLGLSNPTIYNPVANPNASTVYTVSLSNGPCISRATYSVGVFQLPPLTINTPSMLIIPGESVELSATSPDSCYWYPNNWLSCSLCDTTFANPEENTTYYCSVMDQHGCINTGSVVINIIPTFYVPNTFTPNDDGKNDIFRPVFTGYVQLSVGIFDRWGEEIYHYNTLDGGWNGMSRGSKCKVDVYVYKIIAVDYMDNTIERIGTVTLLK